MFFLVLSISVGVLSFLLQIATWNTFSWQISVQTTTDWLIARLTSKSKKCCNIFLSSLICRDEGRRKNIARLSAESKEKEKRFPQSIRLSLSANSLLFSPPFCEWQLRQKLLFSQRPLKTFFFSFSSRPLCSLFGWMMAGPRGEYRS